MGDDLNKFDETTGSVAWAKFQNAMREIVRIPRSDIKAKLDAEDAARRRKRSRSSKIRAFKEANSKI